MNSKLLFIGLSTVLAAGASAVLIDPGTLQVGDGGEPSFEYVLQHTWDASYSVGSESPLTYGNQDGGRLWSTGGTAATTVVVTYAGLAPDTTLGWYTSENAADMHAIETGGSASTVTFTPGTTFGLYIQYDNSGYGGKHTFFSQDLNHYYASLDTFNGTTYQSDTLINHVASIAGGAAHPNSYFLGWEDLANSHADYNDLILTLSTTSGGLSSVPEPFTLALCAAGLGLAALRRRRTR